MNTAFSIKKPYRQWEGTPSTLLSTSYYQVPMKSSLANGHDPGWPQQSDTKKPVTVWGWQAEDIEDMVGPSPSLAKYYTKGMLDDMRCLLLSGLSKAILKLYVHQQGNFRDFGNMMTQVALLDLLHPGLLKRQNILLARLEFVTDLNCPVVACPREQVRKVE